MKTQLAHSNHNAIINILIAIAMSKNEIIQ